MPIRILGISAYYHDSAAALVEDGRIVAAAQEERFTRKKHDADFPSRAVEYCLREAGLTAGQLDLIGFYEKPLVKFDRLLETYVASAPRGMNRMTSASENHCQAASASDSSKGRNRVRSVSIHAVMELP